VQFCETDGLNEFLVSSSVVAAVGAHKTNHPEPSSVEVVLVERVVAVEFFLQT